MEWSGVSAFRIADGKGDSLDVAKDPQSPLRLSIAEAQLRLSPASGKAEERWALDGLEAVPMSARSLALRSPAHGAVLLLFPAAAHADAFRAQLAKPQAACLAPKSVFDNRTEEASANQYFQFYGYLSQQQNMLQDYVRTATYQQAIIANLPDFKDKVVLDVGAGSGILSFFAAQAGARKVYAVEASTMAVHCSDLVRANGLQDRIIVVPGKIEEIQLPEKVDVIISEPMGYMLLNERMLETYLHAKKFLKPDGKMFPTRGDLHVAPFTDESLYLEQTGKAAFWAQESFHGVNLSSLRPQALKEYFKQPVVDTFHVGIVTAQSFKWSVDFLDTDEKGLINIDIPVSFNIATTAHIHGLAFWFDVAFIGSVQTVWLSTAPTEALTHWYQVRCLFTKPILGKAGDVATGRVRLIGNARQSYDVEIELEIDGVRVENSLDLKNPYFRYGGQVLAPPPGSSTSETSPTDAYWGAAPPNVSAAQPSTGPYGATLGATSFIPQQVSNGGTSNTQTSGSNVGVGALNGLDGAHPMTIGRGRSTSASAGDLGRFQSAKASTWGPSMTSFSLSTMASSVERTSQPSVMEMIFEKQAELGPDWVRELSRAVPGDKGLGSVISLPVNDQSALRPVDAHPFSSPYPHALPQLPLPFPASPRRIGGLPHLPSSPFIPTAQARAGGVPMLATLMGGEGDASFPAALASHALGSSLGSSIGHNYFPNGFPTQK